MKFFLLTALFLASIGFRSTLFAAAPGKTIDLWPQEIPGGKADLGEEKDTSKPGEGLVAGQPLIRLGNVTKPTLTIYPARGEKRSTTTVLVCPGGGYTILALDLEGTEVCDWFNSIGVSAALLKYRVPTRPGDTNHIQPLQDAQRAMALLRAQGKLWDVPTNQIGVLGFSAGGHLAAALSTVTEKKYAATDESDKVSSRPDFAILIYAAYLTRKEEPEKLSPEFTIDSQVPPTFMAIAQNDPVKAENALFYFLALKKAGVQAELHIYPTGGHGYGLRRTEHFVTTWPDRAADWMRSRKLLAEK